MHLRELKCWFLLQTAQIIIFERNTGLYKDSCHTFWDLHHLAHQSVYDSIPLLGSVREMLTSIKPQPQPIEIPAVHDTQNGQDRYFDHYFRLHPKNSQHIVWVMLDQSNFYLKLREIQQERNELRIQLENGLSDHD